MAERPPKPPDREPSPRFKARKAIRKSEAPRTLRDLARKRPNLEQWDEAWNEIRGDAPRAAAILAATFVQGAIVFALRQRFLEKPPFDIERLIEPPGPLSSFYSCIELGLALGAYGPVIYGDLHVIRRIRNGFAHAMIPLTFDTPEVILELDQLGYLNLVKSRPPRPITERLTPRLADFVSHGMIPSNSNREKYTITCELLWDAILGWGGGDIRSKAVEPYLP